MRVSKRRLVVIGVGIVVGLPLIYVGVAASFGIRDQQAFERETSEVSRLTSQVTPIALAMVEAPATSTLATACRDAPGADAFFFSPAGKPRGWQHHSATIEALDFEDGLATAWHHEHPRDRSSIKATRYFLERPPGSWSYAFERSIRVRLDFSRISVVAIAIVRSTTVEDDVLKSVTLQTRLVRLPGGETSCEGTQVVTPPVVRDASEHAAHMGLDRCAAKGLFVRGQRAVVGCDRFLGTAAP